MSMCPGCDREAPLLEEGLCEECVAALDRALSSSPGGEASRPSWPAEDEKDEDDPPPSLEGD